MHFTNPAAENYIANFSNYLQMQIFDSISWVMIGAVMLIYLKQRGLISSSAYVVPRQNVDEPDVSRWRHDGTQTYNWDAGNRAPVRDETAYELSALIGH